MRQMVVAMVGALAAVGVAAAGPGAGAASFPGTVTLYIGFGVGGGYDQYARLAARHLGRHLPGEPQIVPSNMPGAGGMRVANYLYEVAPKDGSAIGIVAEGAPLEQVLGTSGIRFDAAAFHWIGRMTSTANLWFTWHSSPARSFDDVRRREVTIASSGRGITAYTPRALNALAGAQFRLVSGYPGSAEVLLALERGEVETAYGLWSWLKQNRAEWIAENRIHPIMLAGDRRLPDLPDVPLTSELGRTPDDNRILAALASSSAIGRSLLAPPGVPPERVAALRAAFAAMLADPAFIADAEKLRLELDPLAGDALQNIVAAVIGVPAPLVEKLRAAVEGAQ